MTKIINYTLLLFVNLLFAQNKENDFAINFKVQINQKPLEIGKNYLVKTDSLKINSLKFYVSNVEIFYTENNLNFKENKCYLIDYEEIKSLNIPVLIDSNKTISKIKFNIGIDNLTNNKGALTDDLDPIKGMYWAWQSGYINIKVEGESKVCKTRKNQFQFHLGGYLEPNNALQNLEFEIDRKISKLEIFINLNQFFEVIKLEETNTIMTPSTEAIDLSKRFKNSFHL